MEEYYVTVANSVPNDFPVYLYNIPQCSSNELTAGVAQNVADRCENIVGIKYSYPDFLENINYLNINNGDFSVLQGTDRLFLPALAMGCEGVVSGVSSVFPEPFVAVYNAYLNNDLEKAREKQKIAVFFVKSLRNQSKHRRCVKHMIIITEIPYRNEVHSSLL